MIEEHPPYPRCAAFKPKPAYCCADSELRPIKSLRVRKRNFTTKGRGRFVLTIESLQNLAIFYTVPSLPRLRYLLDPHLLAFLTPVYLTYLYTLSIMPSREEVAYFGAGPAPMPTSVLKAGAEAVVNYKNSGLSLCEISHRSSTATEILANTKARLTELLDIPEDYEILLMHGGG